MTGLWLLGGSESHMCDLCVANDRGAPENVEGRGCCFLLCFWLCSRVSGLAAEVYICMCYKYICIFIYVYMQRLPMSTNRGVVPHAHTPARCVSTPLIYTYIYTEKERRLPSPKNNNWRAGSTLYRKRKRQPMAKRMD